MPLLYQSHYPPTSVTLYYHMQMRAAIFLPPAVARHLFSTVSWTKPVKGGDFIAPIKEGIS
jgi:hypothetical protein